MSMVTSRARDVMFGQQKSWPGGKSSGNVDKKNQMFLFASCCADDSARRWAKDTLESLIKMTFIKSPSTQIS